MRPPLEKDVQAANFDFVHLLLDLFVPSSANMREHWAARHRRVKAQRATTLLMLRLNGKFPTEFDGNIVVTLTRTGGRRLDDDNLKSAFKAVRDGVSDWLGIDDGSNRIEWRYEQKIGGKKGTIIRVSGIVSIAVASKNRVERALRTPADSNQAEPPVSERARHG